MRRWIVGLVACVCGAVAWAADALPVEIKPDDAKLYYIGRFDHRDAAGPRFTWSNSMVRIRFHGTDLQAKIKDDGDNYYEVIVDGKVTGTIHSEKGKAGVVDLAKGLADGEHVVDVVRRTEGHTGIAQFQGFYLNAGGTLLEPQRLGRKIEVIGDSISCGYGNESPNENVHFLVAQENAYQTYGAIAARKLGAEYVCVAFSGRKLWPDNTMPELYDRSLTFDAGSNWDFKNWQPDVVLINLATNDFGGQKNPDEEKWCGAYEQFIKRIRGNYPNAMIYIASGSMMSDGWPPERKTLTTLKKYLERIKADMAKEGETKIRIINFDPQNGAKDGMGGDWHPSLKTHQKMADKLVAALETDMGWKEAGK